ncbi:MAG TPA: glycosyltransferase [Vicinamibacterales bacterium]|nr:glycosyltransferase [Vicinamibacterales bacterium]
MRILFLTHRLPYAPNRGDRIRAYYLLRQMSRFASVSLFSLIHDDAEAAEVTRTPFAARIATARVHRVANLARGALSLPSNRPLTHALLDGAGARHAIETLIRPAPDVVVAFCSGMARFALAPPLDELPFVLDMVDVDSAKWQAMGATAGPRGWIYRREARTLAAFEARAARRAALTLVVNDRECETLRALAPDAPVTVLPNGIDLEAYRPHDPPAAAPEVIFCGVMSYAPNEAAVQWFAAEVWPLVRRAVGGARFTIVGSEPTAGVRRLAAIDPSIRVVGAVPAVQPYLWASAVSVAPLQLARGVQNKALEAIAAGVPVVATTTVVDGLPTDVRPACITADTAEAFAQAVQSLLALTPEQRRARATHAAIADLGWDARLAPLEDLLLQAIGRG